MATDQQERITVIDALRGFTLLGILIVHTYNLWGDFYVPESTSNLSVNLIDTGISSFIGKFMSGKFHSIFTVLFGISFFIMLNRAETKGIDFRFRFVWRMIILIFIGCMHELIYTWETLLSYGILGIPLIFFYKFKKRTILITAVCCLAISSLYTPFYENIKDKLQPSRSSIETVVQIDENSSSNETFKTFFADHLKHSTVKRLDYFFKHSEAFCLFGLFLLGLYLGKIKFFENTDQKKRLYQKIFWISICIFCLFFCIQKLLYNSNYKTFSGISDDILDYSFTSAMVSIFILLYSTRFRSLMDYLIPYGKMGLTNYIAQSVFGLVVFAPFCMGLNTQGLTVRIIIALMFYIVQIFVCTWHLKYFRYGPLEWFWRSATYLKRVPFLK